MPNALLQKLARAIGVTSDGLIRMYEDDDEGDGEPAGVALMGAAGTLHEGMKERCRNC